MGLGMGDLMLNKFKWPYCHYYLLNIYNLMRFIIAKHINHDTTDPLHNQWLMLQRFVFFSERAILVDLKIKRIVTKVLCKVKGIMTFQSKNSEYARSTIILWVSNSKLSIYEKKITDAWVGGNTWNTSSDFRLSCLRLQSLLYDTCIRSPRVNIRAHNIYLRDIIISFWGELLSIVEKYIKYIQCKINISY